jgi:5-methylthioadenosine/S-adenosylhomocysteine deaminase
MRKEPGVLRARDVVWMATRGGARTLGLEHDIGSIEIGKRADLIVIDRNQPHLSPESALRTELSPYSALVYAARSSDVTTTIVDGDVLMERGELTRLDRAEVVAAAREAARALAARAGV